MTALAPGQLLVATPVLVDPHFAASVVLLLDLSEGALGVVLNRPSGVAVSDVLAPWSEVVDQPEVLYQGGPVGTDGALAVGRLRVATEPPVGFRTVAGGLGIIDLDTPVELVADALAGLRIYAGYAGWGADQLEGEIAQGAWDVVPGAVDHADAFRADVTHLWRDVLRRQPGDLAWHSTRPSDAALN